MTSGIILDEMSHDLATGHNPDECPDCWQSHKDGGWGDGCCCPVCPCRHVVGGDYEGDACGRCQ